MYFFQILQLYLISGGITPSVYEPGIFQSANNVLTH